MLAKNRFMELMLNELRDEAYENTQIYKEQTKRWHDSRLRGDKDFKAGDKVSIQAYPGVFGWRNQFSVQFVGPRERNIDEYWWRIYKSGMI
ncbi:hypothetical protein Tco_0865748 [Tanacetum coccineum]